MSISVSNQRWAKVTRYFAYCAATLVAIVIAAAFVLPELLDSPAVRAEIQRKLSEAVQGEVAWDDLRIRILPAPRGVLRGARVEIPGIASVRAEEVDARLLFWPLLRGRAEITTVSVVRPEIRIDIAPSPPVDGAKREKDAGGLDPVAIYRSVMEPVAGIFRRFAPDTVISVEDARLDVRAAGIPPIELRDLSVRARSGVRGLDLELTAASNYWSRLKLSARVEFSDLAAKANLDITDVTPQAWLDRYLAESPVRVEVPAANLRAQAGYGAKTSLECDFEVTAGAVDVLQAKERIRVADARLKGRITADAQEIAAGLDEVTLGPSRLHGVRLRYSPRSRSLTGGAGFDIDVAQGMDHTRRLIPEKAGAVLAWFQPVTGRARGNVKLDLGQRDWRVGVAIRKSDVAVQIRDLPGPVHLGGGEVEIDRNKVKLDRVALSMPAGKVSLTTLQYVFKDNATAGSASFDLDLTQLLELARRALPEGNRDALSVIQSLSGRAAGTAKVAITRKDWSAGVEIVKSDAQVQVRDLPGPAGIASGSAQITPTTVSIDRAVVTLLDASATASVTISDFRNGPSVRGTVAEGAVGANFLDWVWQTAGAPPHLELKTPFRITVPQFRWGPKQALELQATARFDAGPGIAVDFGWTPAALDVRRAALKDERSDAAIAMRSVGRLVEGKFSGTLYTASVAAMLKKAAAPKGHASGEFRFTLDRDNPRRTTADGTLKGEALDLGLLIDQPVKIERIDVAVDGETLQIRDATVDWAGQRVTIRGEVTRTASGPVIDAQLDSPGVIVDALLPREAKTTGEKPPAAEGQVKQALDEKGEPSRLWPLPVTGRIAVRSDFVQSGRLKVAPVVATVLLEERRVRLDLTQAQLCGISLPLTVEATPQGFAASVRIAAQKQQLEETAHCLTDHGVLITGDFDLRGDLSTEGKADDLVRNLKGMVRADVRDGKVMKFALLGNILSMGNIAALLEKDGPRLNDTGFPYRSLMVAGHFREGRFIVEESAFRSDAIGLAANGWISLLDYESRLSVLVAPFGRFDQLARKLPILGYVVGGAFTSLPVGISGDIRDPLVVPLGPGAITSELVGIFERTLKLPAKLITPTE